MNTKKLIDRFKTAISGRLQSFVSGFRYKHPTQIVFIMANKEEAEKLTNNRIAPSINVARCRSIKDWCEKVRYRS